MDKKRKHSSRRASFVKVLEDNITKKLPIPPAFSKIFEGDIPPWFILEIAGTRKCWRVDVEQDENGRMYFGCGFDCFIKAEALEAGNFLLFTLEESSILQVKIYEKDGSEKTEGTTFESECKVGSSESPMTPRQTPNHHQETEAILRPVMTPEQYGTCAKPHNDNSEIKRKRSLVSATEEGLCFSMTWKNVNHLVYYLTIPRAMLTGKTFSNAETVIVKNQDGNSWPVELTIRPDGRVDLARGWREFVIANDLTNGDTLTLGFVSDKVIQVLVERVTRVDSLSGMEEVCKTEPPECFNIACENEERAANCNIYYNTPVTAPRFERVASGLKSSSFSVTFTPTTRNSPLHVPKAIASKHKLEHKDRVVLCDPDGRHWLIEVRTRQSDGRVGLGRGLCDFMKSYGIGVGDTLIFEFVTDRMLNVKIIEASNLDRVNVSGNMLN